MQLFEQLEKEWAEFNSLDPRGMVACSSGTAALHLALEAFRLPQESEVVVPDFTMVACARAVTLAGLTPVFVDCDERLLIDSSLLEHLVGDSSQVTGKVGVIMSVHLYGRRQNMDWITQAPIRCNPYFVEDLAEAHGIRPHEDTNAACWSFYKNKIVAGEEGGAVWFRDPTHAALARQLRSLGFTDAHDFDHVPRGHNYRMSNLHAKAILGCEEDGTKTWLGIEQSLAHYSDNVHRRRQIEGWYEKYCPTEWRMPARDAVWVYDLRIPGMTRDEQLEVVKALNGVGIAARMSFLPMSNQAEYAGCRRVTADGPESPAYAASREVFYLPVRPGETTEADCRRAFDVIQSVYNRIPPRNRD